MDNGVYLDVCCLNRPFDDQSQARIRLEAEAVIAILERVTAGEIGAIRSRATDFEIAQMPDMDRRQRVETLLVALGTYIDVTPAISERARRLEGLGFGGTDALHIACAEAAQASVMLTTDDKLLRRAARCRAERKARVLNPLVWIQEILTR